VVACPGYLRGVPHAVAEVDHVADHDPDEEADPRVQVQLEHQVQIREHAEAGHERHQRHLEGQLDGRHRLHADHHADEDQHEAHQAQGHNAAGVVQVEDLLEGAPHEAKDGKHHDAYLGDGRGHRVGLAEGVAVEELPEHVRGLHGHQLGHLLVLVAQHEHANCHDGVGEQGSDRHHVHQLVQVEEESHDRWGRRRQILFYFAN